MLIKKNRTYVFLNRYCNNISEALYYIFTLFYPINKILLIIIEKKTIYYNWFCQFCTCLGRFWWTITDRSSRIRVHVHASGYYFVRETVWWTKRTRRLHEGVQLRVLDRWSHLHEYCNSMTQQKLMSSAYIE